MPPHPTSTALLLRLRGLLAAARTELTALAALSVAIGGVLAFIEIADDFTEADGLAVDAAVLSIFYPGPDSKDAIGPWWVQHAAMDLTALGGVAVLALLALTAVGFLVIRGRKGSALQMVLALAGGLMLSEAMKDLFERDRPPAIHRSFEALNASFPSGHAVLSTVFYLTLGAMLARTMEKRRLKAYVMGAAVTFALIVGLTRVYLAAHWLSDVMAGWCLGAAWAMACWLVAYAINRRRGSAELAPGDHPT